MKKKIAALGLAVSVMAGSVMPVYADVKVEGVSTTNTSNTGSVSAPAGEAAIEVTDGDSFTQTGDVEKKDSDGAAVEVLDEGSHVEVEGNITSEGSGVDVGDGSAEVKGDITAKKEAVTNMGGDVSVKGDVKSTEPDGSTIDNVAGSVSVEGNVSGSGTAVMNDGGTVTVKGDISTDNPNTPTRPTESSNQAEGIYNTGGGKVTVDGNVTTTGKGTDGIYNEDSGEVTVNGNVQSSDRFAIGAWSESTTKVNGNVTGDGSGVFGDYTAIVEVNGNITAGKDGIIIQLWDWKNGSDVKKDNRGSYVVDGTIKTGSGSDSIIIKDGNAKSAHTKEQILEVLPDIIVYEMETSGGGAYVGYDETRNPTKTQAQIDDINSAVAKKINYIIRTEKNNNASMNLQGTRKMSGYDTANAKDSIIIRVSTISGYEVSGVNGGKAVAVKNADGTWTLTVPEGGGVDISVAVKQIADAEQKQQREVNINPNRGGSSKAEWSKSARNNNAGGSSDSFVTGTWNTDPATGAKSFTFNNMQAVSQWILTTVPGTTQNAWYYFNASGVMLTGWQKIRNADGKTYWYYLNPEEGTQKGVCLTNTVTPDGFTVNGDGAWTVNGVVQEVAE